MLALRLDETTGQAQSDLDLLQLFLGPTFDGIAPEDEDITLFRNILQTQTARKVLDWWLTLAEGGTPPLKSLLSVREMAPFISSIALIECDLHDDARVRLAGYDLEQMFGRSLTGQRVNDLVQMSPELRCMLYQAVDGRPGLRYSVRDLRQVGKEYRIVGVLEMPVVDTGAGAPLVLAHFEALNVPTRHVYRH
ncbi:MAG: PAS domain-containing protein [Alphaproteobacteria bacterium]|nr:MAG: PAS domain-containing protein [Alphaproteobacteria bacterium]